LYVTLSNTVNGNTSSSNELVPKAPSYNELFHTILELTERLQKLESTADLQSVHSQTSKPDTTLTVDYRILPDVGTSIWLFTEHESSSRSEDWISSVDRLEQVNQ